MAWRALQTLVESQEGVSEGNVAKCEHNIPGKLGFKNDSKKEKEGK